MFRRIARHALTPEGRGIWCALVNAAVVFCLSCGSAVAGQPPPAAITARDVAHPPSLDGIVDESWAGAVRISDFHQREPVEGQPPTEQTIVEILYDKKYLYFGIRCLDAHPSRIAATELRRDADDTVDDSFSILISPDDDGRNGYVFTINPLGTQFDELVTDEGLVQDPNWDGIWVSQARITPEGWTATIAIPFSTLNFNTAAHPTLGINFRRFIRRKNEEDLWRAFRRIDGLNRISQAGELTGLRGIGSGRLLVLRPYGLTGYRSDEGGSSQMLHTGGFGVTAGIRSGLLANLTVNTDFAAVDVDPQRLNLTPFGISLPEKRHFFLENGGEFIFGDQQRNQLFFSRQIGIDPVSGEQVPLDVGGKVSGAAGPYEVGVLAVKTGASGPNPAADYFVGRVKRRLFAESYIGAIAVDKRDANPLDRFNRAGGLDADFVLFRKLTLSGFLAKTSSFQPALRGHDWSDEFQAEYNSDVIQARYRRQDVQPNFNPEVGFVSQTDLASNYASFEWAPRPAAGPVRQYNVQAWAQRGFFTSGALQTQEWQTTFRAYFNNGAYTDDDLFDNTIQRLLVPFNIFGDVYIPAGEYHFDRHQFTYGSDRAKSYYYTLYERFGTFYNGTLNEFQATFTSHPTPRLVFELSHSWDRFNLGAQVYNVQVGTFDTSYSINRFVTTSWLVQVNTIEPNPVSANLRLRYRYHPGSDLYVVYNDGSQFQSIAAGNPELVRERRLTIKIAYAFVR